MKPGDPGTVLFVFDIPAGFDLSDGFFTSECLRIESVPCEAPVNPGDPGTSLFVFAIPDPVFIFGTEFFFIAAFDSAAPL